VDNEPLGILNTTGIGSVTLDAANTLDWGDVVDMETAIAIDNALVNSLAYVAPATICGNMKKSEKVGNTAKFIMEGGRVNGYPCMMSNQVTAGHIIFGNWRDLVIGEWSGVDVNVDIATLSKSGGIRVVVIQDVDVAVRHPESFADGYKE
jgi:HK97 family phage major capsid protein